MSSVSGGSGGPVTCASASSYESNDVSDGSDDPEADDARRRQAAVALVDLESAARARAARPRGAARPARGRSRNPAPAIGKSMSRIAPSGTRTSTRRRVALRAHEHLDQDIDAGCRAPLAARPTTRRAVSSDRMPITSMPLDCARLCRIDRAACLRVVTAFGCLTSCGLFGSSDASAHRRSVRLEPRRVLACGRGRARSSRRAVRGTSGRRRRFKSKRSGRSRCRITGCSARSPASRSTRRITSGSCIAATTR